MNNIIPSVSAIWRKKEVRLDARASQIAGLAWRPAVLAVWLSLFTTSAMAADPVAVDDSPTAIDEGGSISGTFNVLDNDTDADGDSLTAAVVASPSNASSFTLNSDGTFDYTHDGSETTSDTFTYQANDGAASSNVATVTITITAVNDAPAAVDDSPTAIDEGGSISGTFNVLDNDTDAEGDSLTAAVVASPSNASSFTLNSDGTFDYTHDGSETTSDTFTYQANDGTDDSNVATVTITITANDSPVAVDDSPTAIDEGGSISGTFNVLDNDTDADGDSLTAAVVASPSNASSFTLNSDGTFDYTHDGSETTSDTFTYQANDGTDDSNVATVTITITAVNDAPAAVDDSPTAIDEGGSISGTFNVLDNDTDAEGDSLTATVVASPSNASSFTLNSDGTFSYTHDGSETTTDSFTYQANDGTDDSNVATVTITITAVNDAPVAVDDSPTAIDEGGSIISTFNVLDNDTDAEGDSLTAAVVASPSNASSFTLNSDGTFDYTHDGSDTTSDTFTYQANDGTDDSNVGTVTITITNVVPVAVDDSPTAIDEGGSISGTFNVLDNDTDADGDSLTAVVVASPSNASSFTLNSDGTFSYTHDSSETTTDSFTYMANDGTDDSNVATVTITITANDAPVAVDDSPTAIDEGGSISGTFNVLDNDTDAEGDSLTAAVVASPSNATSFTLNSDGTFDYTHDGSETTSDTFTYMANDGTDDSNVATVTITITAVNDAPVAVDDSPTAIDEGASISGTFNVLDNDTDAEGDSLTAAVVSGPSNASVDSFSLNSDGTFSYTHDGSETITDSFTYMANDGTDDSEAATVTITINPVNDVPELVTLIGAQSASEDSLFTLDISANFSDPDGDTLTFSAAGLPASLADIDPDTGVIEGTPTQEEAETDGGIYIVTVTATDDSNESVSDSFTLTVIAVNDAPEAIAQALATDEDTPAQITLTGTDAEGDLLSFAVVQQPANGSLSGTAPDLTYSPNLDFSGADSFTFTVNDGELTSAAATISITINSVNDSPMLTGEIEDQLAVEASAFTLDVSNYFTDVDGDTLVYSLTGELPESGTITFNTQTGVLSGMPVLEDARDNDPYIITIAASDGIAGSTNAVDTFNLAISALDRANVSLMIDAAPDPALLNDELSWTFNVQNTVGPQEASNVALTGAFIGDGLSISSPSSCSINPGATVSPMVTHFECTVGSVPIGDSVAVVLTSTANLVGDATVFAIAEGLDSIPIDPNLDDNSDFFAIGIAEFFSNGAVQVLGSAGIRSAAVGDLDGDGSPELISGTVAGQPVQIWISSGFRDFATAPITLPDTGANEGVSLADFDQDGNLDIVVANGNGQADQVWGGDGAGNFTIMATLTSTFANDVAVGDFNNDGQVDIAIAAEGGNPIFHGNGNGGFSLQRELSDASSQDVAVADFDNDGRDDVVFANVGGSSKIWSGARNITLSTLAIGDVTSVAAGQLGGDSRPDLVFGRIPAGIGDAPSNPVFIWDGGFSSPSALLGASPTFDVHTGDVNSDGLTDIVFINSSGVHQIWNANSNGGFDLHSEQVVADSSVAGVLGDFGYTDADNPGGIDLAMGGGFPQLGLGIYLNDGFGNLGRGDAVPPVLTLNGNTSVSVPSGSAYNDEGATAEDNIDGDITGSVRVTSTVNTQVVGTYTVTYNVTDFAGNEADQITRTVKVDPAAGTGGGGGGMVDLVLLLSLLVLLLCSSNAGRASIIILTRQN